MEKKKKRGSNNKMLLGILAVLVLIPLLTIVILAMLGPSIGNIFSNVVTGLNDPSSAAYGSVSNQDVLSYTSAEQRISAPAMVLASAATQAPPVEEPPAPQDMFFEDYGTNPFVNAAEDNLSTFAMDVDTGSYTLARSYLNDANQLPAPEAIRPEEFINYFPPNYAAPQDAAFAIHMNAAPAPFGADEHLLLRVGIQGKTIAPEDRDPALLIFVIDVSGSMDAPERLGRVKESLALLVEELREDDRVGIVIYASEARLVLEPTPASDKTKINAAINGLTSEGSTYAEAGLMLGYNLARQHQREGSITRVILLSDGVANVGETGPDAILNTVRAGVNEGITLSTIGFGMGNYNDVLMEQLANDGNGNYYYVDNIREARRIFVNNLTSTLQVIEYDAKIQVEFNPEVVAQYRLIGYENRAVADEDFRDDTVDAGEVGAGHSVTALYEIELKAAASGTLATAYIRYEDADSRDVVEINNAIGVDDVLNSFDDVPTDFKLQAAAAEFSELLRQSSFAEGGTYGAVLRLIQPFAQSDVNVAELVTLLQKAIQFGDK